MPTLTLNPILCHSTTAYLATCERLREVKWTCTRLQETATGRVSQWERQHPDGWQRLEVRLEPVSAEPTPEPVAVRQPTEAHYLCTVPTSFARFHHSAKRVLSGCGCVYRQSELTDQPTEGGVSAYYAPCGHFHGAQVTSRLPLTAEQIERSARPQDRARWEPKAEEPQAQCEVCQRAAGNASHVRNMQATTGMCLCHGCYQRQRRYVMPIWEREKVGV